MTQIAAQMYTLRDEMKTPEQMGETLKRVKAVGYDAVQLSGHGPVEPQRMAGMVREAGLAVAATHVSFERLEQELDAVVADHRLWQCPYVGIGSMPAPFHGSLEGARTFARRAGEIARRLQDQGLTLIYHNHNFEFHRVDGPTRIYDVLLQETPGCLQFELDTYWVQAAGGDPAYWIHQLSGRMDVIHFKDMAAAADGTGIMAEVGEGNLNWPEILAACGEIGVKWHIVEQDICQRPPLESLRLSLHNLRAMGLR